MTSEDLHVIDLPKRIIVGRGVLGRLGGYVGDIVARGNVLVVTGPRVYGLYSKVVSQSLEDAGHSVSYKIVKDSSVGTAEDVAEEAARERIDVIVGLGGGKSIDVAKYAAKESSRVFVSVPTVASHDGITSPFSSLKGFERPVSRPAVPPRAIIIDLDVIAKAPRRHNIAGFGDLIGKYTAVLDWRLAHKLRLEYYGDYAASLALMSAKHVSQYAREIGLGTINGIRVLVEALVSSGVAMCIAGSSRPASGSEHLFAHALSLTSKNPPLHGEAVGVGTIMMAYLHGKNWRKIRRLLMTVGAPVNARELGVGDDEVINALVIAPTIRPERYTILGDKRLDERAAERIARATKVID